MFRTKHLKDLLQIDFPLIQAGMIWCSPWQLASEVSNCGGLGVIGAGSMYPEILEEHIIKCKKATNKPFAVNLPLLYPQMDDLVRLIIDQEVPVVITSAGNPKKWTSTFKEHGIKVLHVVSNLKFALKAQEAGVDAVIAEGFEAGGHNGRDETTTFCLIPIVKQHIEVPLVAAGGISSGKSMLAAMVLGADGVQVGSRFVASEESSAHINFKQRVLASKEGDTILTLKELAPVRLIKNEFYLQVEDAYKKCSSVEDLKQLLGRARAKKGMFEGDMKNGELEIGQVSALIDEIKPAQDIFHEIVSEFEESKKELQKLEI